ncbi:MAG: DUF2330 domain-containing protein [Chloroflexota bacterium]
MRIFIATMAAFLAAVGVVAAPGVANACAGLIGSNGSVQLGTTTTLAGYDDGQEQYVTSFEFQGGGGQFGALIPLPGIPSNIERGGDWTLQRLERETTPVRFEAASFDTALAGSPRAEVIQEVTIDALDLTVLKGGGADVAAWAQEHNFSLSADAPEVLDFYAQRSPIFMAAVFDGDAAAARGQQLGDGTPVHLTIPTDNPWVPLRILGLGKLPSDIVTADVFLLTDQKPALLPLGKPGLDVSYNQTASNELLTDLRTDKGGSWVPEEAWLTKLQINSTVSDLNYDLAVDTSSAKSPSRVAAGLELVSAVTPSTPTGGSTLAWYWAAALGAAIGAVVLGGWRPWGGRR